MRFAYVGCRTTKERNARGLGIEVYRVNDETGDWTHQESINGLVNPSYLSFDREKKFLYTVHGDYSEISSFAVDSESGTLKFINTADSEGENPVHLIPDTTNKYMLVTNLQNGTVVAIERRADGSLGSVKYKTFIDGIKEGSISHPHQIIYDNKENFLFVPSQGRKEGVSKTDVLKFEAEKGFSKVNVLITREKAEARHLVFHPNNIYAYLINEKDNTVCFHTYDENAGKLQPVQILSTLPETYTGNGQASEIIISKDGKYLYASNRIHDSITIYSIDQQSGMMKTLGWVSSKGKTPRFITFDPTGRFLYAANEESDTIVTFSVEESGMLTYTGQTIETGSPVCIIFS